MLMHEAHKKFWEYKSVDLESYYSLRVFWREENVSLRRYLLVNAYFTNVSCLDVYIFLLDCLILDLIMCMSLIYLR